MSSIPYIPLRQSVVNGSGRPYAAATATFYRAGTTTALTVYADAARTSSLGSVVTASAAGKFSPIYLDPTYNARCILKDSSGNTLSDDDNIPAAYGATYTTTTAEAGITVVSPQYPPGDIRRYGTNASPGTTNMTAAIQAALDQYEAGGSPPVFQAETYFLGNRSSGETVLTLSSLSGGVIYGNGATLKINTTDASAPVILKIADCKHLVVNELRGNDPGYVQATQSGAVLFDICALGATDEDIGHMAFNDCHLYQGCLFARVRGDATGQNSTNQVNRIRDIRFSNCSVNASFYGLNFQNHGDDVVIEGFNAEDTHRTYFAYGIAGHDVAFHSKNPRGGYAQALIKAYDRSTESIRLRAYFGTCASSYECVTLEFQNTTQDESIRDIDIDINCRNTVSNAKPILFRAYDNADPIAARTTTTNRWDNIRIRGDWTGFTSPLTFTTSQTTEGRLYIAPELVGDLTARYQTLGGFALILGDREIRTYKGSLATGITIPMAHYNACAFAMEFTTYCQDSDSAVAVAAQDISQDLVLGYKQDGNNVVVTSTTNVKSAYAGADATLTYAASGTNITVTATGTGYDSSNSYMCVTARNVSRFR